MEGKPSEADGFIDRMYKIIETSTIHRETIKIVQFSDAHLDLLYNEGSNADCSFTYCCRKEIDEIEKRSSSVPAGKWGMRHYQCDPPQITFENVLEEVKKQQAEYLFWTGDSTPHDDDFITQDEVTQTLSSITKIVQTHFPNSSENLSSTHLLPSDPLLFRP